MKVTREKRVACKKIEGCVYMVSPWDHKLHKLNEAGSFICEFIEKKFGKKDIIKKITEEFDVSFGQAEKDYEDFLEKLTGKGLFNKEK